ncbi:hypothetical protein DCMF_11975 [Candidatus Formimonas warabiya]|uniref:Glycosyltransferase family 1 protein n=2 Tax=Formimonas warabiya TaxID=1761012 RepID=A0A3G1KSA3_FORW1|nr:hypothetical protein DCMF_11975 [Candidatus Formimonas warabiya]
MTEYPEEYHDILYLFNSFSQYQGLKTAMEKPKVKKSFQIKNLFARPRQKVVVIYPPTIDWHWMKQRPQQLMEQFALHGYEVYYCNMTQCADRAPEQVQQNLTVVHDHKKFLREIVPVIKSEGKKILVWTSWSKLALLVDQYFPDFVIYDYLDDFPSWAPYLSKMVHRADLVVSTAGKLKNHIVQDFPGKACYLIPNGCDIKHFQRYRHTPPPDKPAEFRGHAGPIIGYIGAWAPWVDKDLVEQIAYTFPRALVAIVGAEFMETPIQSVVNVVHAGLKPYEFLPQYAYYCDVCLIPFRINQVTISTNPIKMYEYLAAGKPVVATDLPEVRNVPHVYVSKHDREFISHLDGILSHPFHFDQDAVNQWLSAHTWERRFQDIDGILKKEFAI